MTTDELLAQAEQLAAAEPTGGVGVAKAAALLESALRSDRDLRLVTRLMTYLRQSGRDRDAALLGGEHVRPDLDDGSFLYEYGVALRGAGLWRQAMEVHTRAAVLHRDDPEAQFAWAVSQSVYGLPTDMIHVVDELTRKFPDNIKYAYGRARVLARLGRLRDAVAQLEQLLVDHPRMTDAKLLLAKIEMDLRWTDRWQATASEILPLLLPASRALWAFHLARASGDLAEASRQILEAFRLAPMDGELYRENGGFFLELYDDAKKPEVITLARTSLEVAVQLLPDDAVARGRLLFAEVLGGESPDLSKAELEADDRPHAGMAMYLARIAAHRGDHATAERWYRHWLGSFADDVVAWCELGELLLDAERFDAAEAAFARAVELSPAYAPPWNGLGYARMQLRAYDGAADAYAKAVAAGASDPGILDAYGLALLETNRLDEAIAQFRAAVAAAPDDELFQQHLAEATAAKSRAQ